MPSSPFVEDQFFGDARQIGHFRFATVLRRYRADVDQDALAEPVVDSPTSASAATEATDDRP